MKSRLSYYVSHKIDKLKRIWFDRKMREYLIINHVKGVEEYDSFRLSFGARIHANAKLVIGSGLCMNKGCVIDSDDSFGIYIGENLLLAPDVYVRGGNHDYSYFEDAFQNHGHVAKRVVFHDETYSIVIEDNVWIGRGATILSGAHIGRGCVIGAGSVVKERIPDYSIVIGNPSRIVSNRRKYNDFHARCDLGLFD